MRALPLEVRLREPRTVAEQPDGLATQSIGTRKRSRKAPTAPSVEADSGTRDAELPPLDLEAARRIAREVDRARERSVSELPGFHPPGRGFRAELGAALARAAPPDCRTAHAGKGLLAIPFLVKDAITGEGCRW